MNEVRITLVFRKIILSGTASISAQRGIPIFTLYIPTTTMRHAKSGQDVYALVAQATLAFECVTLKESTAGSLRAPSPTGRAMELYCIGLASISTLKTGNERSSTLRRDNALRISAAGPSTLLDSITGLPSCSGFMALIRAASPQR